MISTNRIETYMICPHCGDQMTLSRGLWLCRNLSECAYTEPAHPPVIYYWVDSTTGFERVQVDSEPLSETNGIVFISSVRGHKKLYEESGK